MSSRRFKRWTARGLRADEQRQDRPRHEEHLQKTWHHRTINLSAALKVATGMIRGKTTTTKKRADFQAFMDEVIADLSVGREIHVVLDNFCSRRKNKDGWRHTPMLPTTLHTNFGERA